MNSVNVRYRRGLLTSTTVSLLIAAIGSATLAECASATSFDGPEVPQIIANVRKAIGLDDLRESAASFEAEGTATSECPEPFCKKHSPERWAFSLDGRFRREYSMDACLPTVLGYDGRGLWMHNVTSGPDRFDDPALLIAHWVMTGAWLTQLNDLSIALVDSESTKDDVVLSMGLKAGPVALWLIIDRGAWLPRALCEPNHRDTLSWELTDYRTELGLRLPHEITIHPRTEIVGAQSYKSSIILGELKHARSADRDSYTAPEPVMQSSFQKDLPPEVDCKVTRFGHILVRVSLNDPKAHWFILDSGSDQLAIDEDEENRLKLQRVFEIPMTDPNAPTRRWVTPKQMEIGPLQLKRPVLTTINLAPLQPYLGFDVVGIIGYHVFLSAVVELDAAGPSVRLSPSEKYEGKGLDWHPLRFSAKLPFVHCRFNGDREADFLIDTGSNGGLSFRGAAVEKFRLGEVPTSGSSRLFGNTRVTITPSKNRFRLDWFEIAGHRLKDIEISINRDGPSYAGVDCAGAIGMEILSQFKVIFDYPHQRIAFVKPTTKAMSGTK